MCFVGVSFWRRKRHKNKTRACMHCCGLVWSCYVRVVGCLFLATSNLFTLILIFQLEMNSQNPAAPIQKGFFTSNSRKGVYLNFEGFQYSIRKRAAPSKKAYIQSRTTVTWACKSSGNCTTRIDTVSETDPTIERPANKPHSCCQSDKTVQGSEIAIPIEASENRIIRFKHHNFIRMEESQTKWVCRCSIETAVEETSSPCGATITTRAVDDFVVVEIG